MEKAFPRRSHLGWEWEGPALLVESEGADWLKGVRHRGRLALEFEREVGFYLWCYGEATRGLFNGAVTKRAGGVSEHKERGF